MRVAISHEDGRTTVAESRTPTGFLKPLGRFAVHYVQMCMVMCAGAFGLSLVFFGAAAVLGYTHLDQRAPVLTVLVVAINLSVPMALWMRHMGMAWRPTLEMSGATMVAGLALVVAYWLDLLARSDLLPLQTGPLACPLMLAVMLVRFPLYSSEHPHHGR